MRAPSCARNTSTDAATTNGHRATAMPCITSLNPSPVVLNTADDGTAIQRQRVMICWNQTAMPRYPSRQKGPELGEFVVPVERRVLWWIRRGLTLRHER